MHEMSIAQSLVELASQAASEAGAERVGRINIRIGALAGVHTDALRFSYEVASEGTMLAGSELAIQETPVTVYCGECRRELALPGIRSFLCPVCGGSQTDLRQGFEMELESVEYFTGCRD